MYCEMSIFGGSRSLLLIDSLFGSPPCEVGHSFINRLLHMLNFFASCTSYSEQFKYRLNKPILT